MLAFQDAKNTVLRSVPVTPAVTVGLRDALRRTLAEDVIADTDLPLFDSSSMDGFAVRAEDTQAAVRGQGVSLTVSGEVSAGEAARAQLEARRAIRISTGAPIPAGANAVVEQELTKQHDAILEVFASVDVGRNIRRKGEEVRKGSVVLTKGSFLSIPALGFLASLGVTHVKVHAEPRVALLTTGSEVVEQDEPLSPGKIRNSNSYTLWGLVSESYCRPVDLGKVGDDEVSLRERTADGLRYDALVTSGGVSVGRHDLVLKALRDLSVEILFWKVNIKPGMPMAFGVYRDLESRVVPVFALPGNPVSTVVTFLEFVRPALRKMSGGLGDHPAYRLFARLEHDFSKSDGKRHFVRGIVRNDKGSLVVRTTGSQSSGMLSSLVAANCLLIIPEDRRDPRAGEEVEIELLW